MKELWKSIKSNRKIQFIYTVLLGVTISYILINFVIQGAVVNGYSMYPTYNNHEYLFIDKISWKTYDDLDRYDVIVCTSKYHGGMLLIKRVIALPGEEIHIDVKGNVFINGEQIEDSKAYYDNGENLLAFDITVTLGEDEYFVAGDNRNDSTDSRFKAVGNIKKKDIIGKVIGSN